MDPPEAVMAFSSVGSRRRGVLAAGTACLAGGLALLALPGGASGGTAPPPEAKVELGRRLFFDPAVSRSGDNSCASCHEPDHGWSDPRLRSEDDFLRTQRHSQTLLDVGRLNAIHWDGEFDTVESLVVARLGVPSGRTRGGYGQPPPTSQPPTEVFLEDEAGEEVAVDLTRLTPVADLVEADGRYAEGFQAAFGSKSVTTARLAEAIAEFVRTIRHTESPYDRHVAGKKDALSPEAKRGLELFRGRAGCAQCHRLEPRPASLTDEKFHVTGIAWKGGAVRAAPHVDPVDAEGRLRAQAERGRARMTTASDEERAFKTPTLRDVAKRPPYMHDGSLPTLESVVRHYAAGGADDPNLDPKLRPFKASDQDVADLVAFLESLSGDVRPALARDTRLRAERTRLRFVDDAGKPLAGVAVRVVPAGDALPGASVRTCPTVDLTTDADGRLEFVPVRRTHVKLVLPEGLRARQGEWIPDTCEEAVVTLPVRGRAVAVVELPAGETAPARLPATLCWPRGGEPRPNPVTPPWAKPTHRALFVLEDARTVGDRVVARYGTWVASDWPKAADLEVASGGRVRVHQVSLAKGAVTPVK
jgi:cytochrome c peroxidase